MSKEIAYLAGVAAERGIGETIAEIEAKNHRYEIASVKKQYQAVIDQERLKTEALASHTEKLERDLKAARDALRATGASAPKRESDAISPHQVWEREREIRRQREHEAYLASLPTAAEIAEFEETQRRGKRVFFGLVLVGLLIWGGVKAFPILTDEDYRKEFIFQSKRTLFRNETFNLFYPLTKPEVVTVENYGCTNCHDYLDHRATAFWIYAYDYKKMRTVDEKMRLVKRLRYAIEGKNAVKRFDLSEKEVSQMIDDILSKNRSR